MPTHRKTDPACSEYRYREPNNLISRYLDRRARGKSCPVCMPPVSPWELLGVAPDFTGGLSVDEYMDDQRGRGDD